MEGTTIILFLRGDWTTREEAVRVSDLPLGADHIDTLRFDSSQLGRWDSSLLVFLSTLREVLRRRAILFDQTGSPGRRMPAAFDAARRAAGGSCPCPPSRER